MTKEYRSELLDEIKSRFPVQSVKIHGPRRVYIRIDRDNVHECSRFLFANKGLRLAIMTGIDTREGIEILYHFTHDEAGTFYTLKTVVPKDDPKIQSLADVTQAANWIEREIRELLGVEFVGHPDPRPLLTADDWPATACPLRRDYVKGEQ